MNETDKLELISRDISQINISLARVEVDLRYHIEGTIQNRKQLEELTKELDLVDLRLSTNEARLEGQIIGQQKAFNKFTWVVGLVGSLLGILIALERLQII